MFLYYIIIEKRCKLSTKSYKEHTKKVANNKHMIKYDFDYFFDYFLEFFMLNTVISVCEPILIGGPHVPVPGLT